MNGLYTKLINEIDKYQPEYYGLEQVVYSAMSLLSEKEEFDLDSISHWLKDTLREYSENEVMKRINERIDKVIKQNPEKEQEFYSEVFILGELNENEYRLDLEKCCEYLDELNPTEWIEWYQWLDDCVKNKKYDDAFMNIPTIKTAKPFEVMAFLALDYIKQALNLNNIDIQKKEFKNLRSRKMFYSSNFNNFLNIRKYRATREIISAFIAIDKAKEWQSNLNLENKEKEFVKKP